MNFEFSQSSFAEGRSRHLQSFKEYLGYVPITESWDDCPVDSILVVTERNIGNYTEATLGEYELVIVELAQSVFTGPVAARTVDSSYESLPNTEARYAGEIVALEISVHDVRPGDESDTLDYVEIPWRNHAAEPIKVLAYGDGRIYTAFNLLNTLAWCDYGATPEKIFGEMQIADMIEFTDEQREERRQRMRTAVNRIVMTRGNSEIAYRENQITAMEQQIQTYRDSIQDELDNIEMTAAAIENLLDRRASQTDFDAERELSAIERHEKVENVTMSGNKLVVKTVPLTLEHPREPGNIVDLGVFKITFDFDQNKVSMRNLTNRRGTYDHPHVNAGRFCAGEWQPSVDRLMRERQLAAANAFVLNCLASVNPNDMWGRMYRHWFDDTVPGEE